MLAALGERRVPVRRLAATLLASLSEAETTQGVVALAHPPATEEERLFSGHPLVVVADALQNPGNLGGLLRTAEAAGASGAYLTEGCADPFSWKALRGSMGSALRLPLVSGLTAQTVLDRLEERGLRVFATATDGETRYDEADLTMPEDQLELFHFNSATRIWDTITTSMDSMDAGSASSSDFRACARGVIRCSCWFAEALSGWRPGRPAR